jgi:hypothetical protein
VIEPPIGYVGGRSFRNEKQAQNSASCDWPADVMDNFTMRYGLCISEREVVVVRRRVLDPQGHPLWGVVDVSEPYAFDTLGGNNGRMAIWLWFRKETCCERHVDNTTEFQPDRDDA